jgi:3D (Asp-Asp-Asp) domain-containing protein/peptidoglycan hydrolase CwlO-like protein
LRTLGAAVLCGIAVGAPLAASSAAQAPSDLEAQADALRERNERLAAGSQTALADLTAIESRLAQARAELASFRSRATQVHRQRKAVGQELRIVRSSLRLTQKALARRLQSLYEQGQSDVLALILGAGSLDEALSTIETVDLAARQDEALIGSARASSKRLARLGSSLAAQERELQQLAAVKEAATASLTAARTQRIRTLASLRAARVVNAGRIASLDDQARTLAAAQASPSTPVSTPGAPSIPAGPASSGVRSVTVLATGYALPGRTASGRPVGWGVVAVDPALIPMGSRLAIPGYGMGVAADTGGAIVGARIDLWFPSVAQAHAWGSRTVTITVYPS